MVRAGLEPGMSRSHGNRPNHWATLPLHSVLDLRFAVSWFSNAQHKLGMLYTYKSNQTLFFFWRRGENQSTPEKNLWQQRREPTNSNHIKTLSLQIEPELHWWKATDLTAAPTLLPKHSLALFLYLSSLSSCKQCLFFMKN